MKRCTYEAHEVIHATKGVSARCRGNYEAEANGMVLLEHLVRRSSSCCGFNQVVVTGIIWTG